MKSVKYFSSFVLEWIKNPTSQYDTIRFKMTDNKSDHKNPLTIAKERGYVVCPTCNFYKVQGSPCTACSKINEAANVKVRDLEKRLYDLQSRTYQNEIDLYRHESFIAKKRSEEYEEQKRNVMMIANPSEAKLQVNYSTKSFPYFSLPLIRATMWIKEATHYVMSYVMPTDISVDGTREALYFANNEREMLNVLKTQRQIVKMQREIYKAVKKNLDFVDYKVGAWTSESEVIAHVLKKHFAAAGHEASIKKDSTYTNIYVHVRINYE